MTRITHWIRIHANTILCIKFVIFVGLIAAHFLQPAHAAVVTLATNVVWLFKL